MDALAERAKKILLHEQRTNHQDAAVKPGGLALFFQNWAAETQVQPHVFAQRLQTMFANYRKLDPMQRAATVRAALTLLEDEKFPDTAAVPIKQSATKTTVSSDHSAIAPPVAKRSVEYAHQAATTQAKPPDAEYLLRSPVTSIPGVGPSMADKLEKLGLFTAQDVLYYLPREHVDYTAITPVSDLEYGTLATIMTLVWEVENIRAPHSKVTRTVARVSDGTSSIRAVWFNQPFLNKLLKPGEQIILTGIKERYGSTVHFTVKTYEIVDKNDPLNTGRIVPVYPLTEGVTAKQIRRITKFVTDKYAPLITEYLPETITKPLKLPSIQWALANYHYPADQESLTLARHRLGFDELFILEIGMIAQKGAWQQPERAPKLFCEPWRIFKDIPAPIHTAAETPPAHFSDGLWGGSAIGEQCFEKSLPFAFTSAQKRVINEILHDMDTATPMCRLLQGDVGSGKTAVAAAAMMACARNGMQSAIMAPTEILAEQHAKSLQKMFAPFGIEVFQLTGNMGIKQRNETLAAIESGAARIIAGTHALIQDGVTFAQLGLVIVDEQHRFGVEQREALRKKGNERTPHLLVMTATPIPRTLALTVYGDLDVSVIDEMPLGRKPIITRWRSGSRREEAYQQMAIEVGHGKQGYIICPLIEESESLEAKAATAEYDRLRSDVFPHFRLGLAHGALKPSDKDSAMRKFRDGETDILVATSVVEVGVDVPNATMIIIEDADRFGLAQLHQFRGRVGRGGDQSYCYLLSASAGAVARERLAVIERTTDGFKLAEEDLRLRGPGEFFGVRQSGAPELRVAQLTDTLLVEQARGSAERLWRQDPSLDLPEHLSLRNRVAIFWRQFTPQ